MFRLFLNFQATFPPHEQQACHLEQCLTHTPPALKLQLFVLKEKKQSFKLTLTHTHTHTHTPLKTEDSHQLPRVKGPSSQNETEPVEMMCVNGLCTLAVSHHSGRHHCDICRDRHQALQVMTNDSSPLSKEIIPEQSKHSRPFICPGSQTGAG